MPSQKILVIDDDVSIQNALKAILQKAGFVVASALDAAQGSMVFRQIKPDLVVLDIQMPAGGGAMVYERLRGSTLSFNVPILVYSVVAPKELESKIAASPLTAFLQKPASPEAIVAAVQSLLGPAGPA